MSATYQIAIDGPAGAGKSTIARALASRLGFVYVDTGAMYRAMAVHFLRLGIVPDDEAAVSRACKDIRIDIRYENGDQQVYLNGENVSGIIRTEEVGNMASATSVYAEVRGKLLDLQRELAAANHVVMDGRDIGTCVLPEAQTKIYLTASVRVRARRRMKELAEKGRECDPAQIERDILERDYRDTHREIAPLRRADDAVYLDTSEMTIAQVLDRIIEAAAERGLPVTGQEQEPGGPAAGQGQEPGVPAAGQEQCVPVAGQKQEPGGPAAGDGR